MVRKPRKPEQKTEPGDRVIDAALRLATERGWRRLSLAEIANGADLTLPEMRALFASKTAILNGFTRRTDARVLAGGKADGSSPRDRLFDVLMRRFDVLEPHRDALRVIVRDVAFDPLAAVCQGAQVLCSMAWMLEAAGLNSSGPVGAIRTKGLMVIYLRTLGAWLGDDSLDMAKTMAVLDRGLARAERLAGIVCPTSGAKPDAPEPENG
ncbi:MAG: TetR family transcriptional regulator [Rhodospirillales bacterium]|nr:TetR family transcriptional regulator [Rhodospirillales bacterium]